MSHRTTPRPSRRAVLGAAAWSVPTIAVAGAAPAYAHSHTTPPPAPNRLVVTSATSTWEPVVGGLFGYYLSFTVVVHNDSPQAVSNLQVSITFPEAYGAVRVSSLGGSVGAGWSNGSVTNRVFTTTRNTALAAGTSASLLTLGRIYVPTNPAGAGPDITVAATGGGGIATGSALARPS